MVKLFNDTFNINEVVDSFSTEVLLENEITIADDMPDMEKIVNAEGKAKLDNVRATTDSIIVDGRLKYNIIYRSNNENYTIHSMTGEIPFREEISAEGVTEDMEAFTNVFIDYIDADQLTERSFLVKAVLILDTDAYMKRPVAYVSNLESDGTIQAKSRNIAYTDIAAEISEEININDAVELSKGSGEIAQVIRSEADVYITNIDELNDKMLIEGICKVGFMFIEDDEMHTIGYVSEEFPFTHYLESEFSNENMLKDIGVNVNDMTYSITENFDDEKKLIEFALPFTVNASFYKTMEKNIIMDCYSTKYGLDLQSETVKLSSLKNLTNEVVKYENNFDLVSGSIKDIYSVDASPKVSEKRIADNKYIIDGFLDVNLLYLNGDINKIDKAFASLPFTAAFPVDEDEALSNIHSKVSVHKCSAYRKGNSSVNFNCDINVGMKFKNDDEVTVIKDIAENNPIDRSKMPSLIFRVVQSEETLWDIAKNYNLSISYLKELNDFPEGSVLEPGSKIIIARSV
ncbi:MAG TPA: DUF3794 domain-containing protein [Sedimentibacter sp.]|nr:DUF3794 domain-containing protein [Sedimentibacter sp.]